MLIYGSLKDVIDEASQQGPTDETLPGIALKDYVVKKTRDPFFASRSELYMFGVAADSTLELKVIPFGQAEFDKKSTLNLTRKVEKDEKFEYLGSGLPLVLPPVKNFLAMRLLFADSDKSARAAAEVIEDVAKAVGSKEAVELLVLTGLPHAAAAAAVFGQVLGTASKMLAKNNDDVIETFEGYFTAADLLGQSELVVDNPGARATFTFVS